MRSGHDRLNSEKPISAKKSYKNIKTFFLNNFFKTHVRINLYTREHFLRFQKNYLTFMTYFYYFVT